jgi:protein-tyrosine phosphatase
MRALPVTGTHALFDLGGQSTCDGRRIAQGRLLRSGYTGPLPSAAVGALRARNLAAIIDLRSPRETSRLPAINLGTSATRHYGLSIGDDSTNPSPGVCGSLIELYLRLISRFGTQISSAAQVVATHGQQGVLVHCTAGRDRTGLVVAVVLRLIGVPDDAIVRQHGRVAEDVSEYVAARRARWIAKGRDPAHFDGLHRDAEAALVAAFTWIDAEYGATVRYLEAHGAPADIARRAQCALIEDVPAEIRRGAEKVLGPAEGWSLTSATNSRVWRVSARGGEFVVKHLTDVSSDARVERDVLAAVGPRRARQIIEVASLDDGGHLVVAPYLYGELMADRLKTAPVEAALGRDLAGQYRDILASVSALPLRAPGFGRLGSGHRAGHEKWSDALRAYLDEQHRKGPKTSALRHTELAKTLDRLASRLDAECGPPRVIPTDVNSRNFLLTDEGTRLVALNFPVVWQGDPVMPFGALQLHLDQTPIAAALAAGGVPPWRMHFYAAYHAFVICVYVERFEAVRLESASVWGRERPLLDLLDEHLRALEEELWPI